MPQQRRRLFGADTDTSFFNVVPTSQFNPDGWGSGQGNLMGVQMTKDKSKVLMMQNGSSPDFEKRIRIYSNSNPNGIIESALDLTFVGQTAEFNFEVGGVRQQLGYGFLYNEDLGKVWVYSVDTTTIVAEWDYNIDTNTQTFVQYVTLPYNLTGGSFYFSADGTQFYASRGSVSSVTIVRYDLTTPFDISTYSVSQTRTWNSSDGLTFTSPPLFYSNGGYGIYLSYYGGSGQVNINKRQFSTPFDFTSIELGTGYRQAIRRTDYISDIILFGQLPIFFSEDLRKMNYFNNNSAAGGRIGIGYFDIPANFRGLGNELGGVRLLPSTLIPF